VKKVIPIYRKELTSYLSSPIAYVVGGVFAFLNGYIFYMVLMGTHDANSVRIVISNMSIILIFITPLFTMRLFSEEKKLGTEELLFTLPVKDIAIILGKFLASLTILFSMIGITFEYLIFLKIFADPDLGPIFSGYLGIFLMSASFVAVGIFASSLSENQVVSGMVSFGILLFLLIIDWAASLVKEPFYSFFKSISVFNHFGNFNKGILDTTDIFFFLALVFIFLFLTARVLETRKW